MPQSTSAGSADLNGISSRAGEKDRERDRDKDKDRSKKGDSKAKDLSHVPCKFFRVGGCTAGSACPFSHAVAEPGQQKSVCTWFVKGSCKFGHKCALAHILPGQPMSMDRRNKKAAQTAANASGGKSNGEKSGKHTAKGSRSGQSKEQNDPHSPGTSPPLGSRSTAGSRPPITISKALPTVSTQVHATSQQDETDFPFGLPDDLPETASSNVASNSPPVQRQQAATPTPPKADPTRKPSPLPFSQPNGSQRIPRTTVSGDFGYGPIGSPPRSAGFHPDITSVMSNGFSPGTSPNSRQYDPAVGLGTSPFSAPGSRSLFMAYSVDRDPPKFGGGHPASLSERAGLRSIREGGSWNPGLRGMPGHIQNESAVADDDELEEFLPSSLNELLTPGERERRRSRTGGVRPNIDPHHQRFSHSVPAPSLLDNVKALWDDPSQQLMGQDRYTPAQSGDWGRTNLLGEDGPSPSLLSTSNASAAFLPSIHRPSFQNVRHASSQSLDHGTGFAPSLETPLSTSQGQGPHMNDTPVSLYGLHQTSRAIPAVGVPPADFGPLSPTARALRSHEPGQSLPKGLAAGLSRLHLVPSTGQTSALHDRSPDGPRMGGLSSQLALNMPVGGGYEHQRSSLTSPTRVGQGMPSVSIPLNGGVRRPWMAHTLSSPLSRPVATNDAEDGLFSMDEEEK